MTIKKILLIIIILVTTGCGYQSLYSSNDKMNFSISEIKESGEKNINRKIISRLNLKKENDSIVKYNLTLDSTKNEEIVSKDNSGNALTFKISIQVNFVLTDVQDSSQVLKEKTFAANFTYNNSDNKFNLSQYNKIIEENLIEKISKDIIIFLNSNV